MGKVIITFVGGSKLLHLWVKCIITFVGEIITFVGKVLLHLWAIITFVGVTGSDTFYIFFRFQESLI